MNIREEWKEFEIIVKRIVPGTYRNLIDHKLFPYFVFGYPVVFLLCLFVAYYFYSLQ